ncbi:right-handed parallel beta-helix repeat-containing protein [Xanthomonas maliensis]|uniref:right-handed parallel beta-helix repeat-containing protein n=1 Tax=Xanthomonas maliensis TaxID=1321368 RepID=UPI0004CE7366|nr:right-handed parallel beta-helix repeat-containing protein [Xanthomonas maliensis]KAB7771344.1 right-handed parallel beta-helix repeat-containing protein [Xanthomonas maliensis]
MPQLARSVSVVLPLLLATACAAPGQAKADPPTANATTCTAKVRPGQDLQKAIDALPQGDKPVTLCLEKGEFPLKGLVSIHRGNLTLHGQGPSTVLRMADGVQQPVLVVGDYENQQPTGVIRDVDIENMQIVASTGDKEFMPERPYLSNSAVVVRSGQGIRLAGLQVNKCRSACLLSEYDTRDLTIENNDVSGAIWDGVSFNRTSQVKMFNNYLHDNVAAGLTTEHLEDSEIRDNRFARNGSQGIYLSDARRNRFANNQFEGNHSAGIFLACAIRYRTPEILCWDNSMSQDNVFENNRFTGNPFTYTIGVDRAANCNGADFKPNVWRHNEADVAGVDIDPKRYGYCVRHE